MVFHYLVGWHCYTYKMISVNHVVAVVTIVQRLRYTEYICTHVALFGAAATDIVVHDLRETGAKGSNLVAQFFWSFRPATKYIHLSRTTFTSKKKKKERKKASNYKSSKNCLISSVC